MSDDDFKELVKNFEKSVKSVFEGMKYTNSDGKEVTAHVIVDVRVVTSKPANLGKGENFFNVETSGVSHVDANMTTGMLNINDRKSSKVIAHEWGHLFGLQDRYHLLFSYDQIHHNLDLSDENRKTIPMIMDIPLDKEYNPYNNLYSSGSHITTYQKDVLFGNKKEVAYTQAMILLSGEQMKRYEKGKWFDAAEVSTKAHKLDVSLFLKGAPTRGYAPAWSTSNKFSNSIPFNCVHGAKSKSDVKEYFRTH